MLERSTQGREKLQTNSNDQPAEQHFKNEEFGVQNGSCQTKEMQPLQGQRVGTAAFSCDPEHEEVAGS